MASGYTLGTDTPDDHDFLCMEYPSKRARMSCGHTVTVESLTDWCERQLKKGKGKFECGADKCGAKWSFEEVCALVKKEKETVFDEKLFKNTFRRTQTKNCPGCDFFVQRSDPRDLSVHCPNCTAKKGRRYEFCWQCLKEWKGHNRYGGRCENEGCTDPLEILRTCKNIKFEHVKLKGVENCPSMRACPTCGFVVEHNGQQCKNMVCPDPNCKVEFCFICLKVTKECLQTSKHFVPCPSGVASRQTSIPVGENRLDALTEQTSGSQCGVL